MSINQLQQDFTNGRPGLAYLIETNDIEGAYSSLSHALFATIYKSYKGAGDTFPDIITVACLADKKDITISQIREANQFMSKSSVISGNKCLIIKEGQLLNSNSSNALLKLMEDSPQGNHIFILANNHNRLLPTICSRCRLIVHNINASTVESSSNHTATPLDILLQLQDSSQDIANIIKDMKESDDYIWQKTSDFAQDILCRISQKKAGAQVDFTEQEKRFVRRFAMHSLDATIMVYEKLASFVDKVNQYDLPKLQSLILLSEYFNLQDDKATI